MIEFLGVIFFATLPIVLFVLIGVAVLGIVFDSDGSG
jgi:hypothetical protein